MKSWIATIETLVFKLPELLKNDPHITSTEWVEILSPRALFTTEESQILTPGISKIQQNLNPKVSIAKKTGVC